ncbi:transcriptional regulator [Ralstonia insidiosa]|uniref:Helix-turn-helix domain-containing protein n=1 Tax=Ralstonia insidiosa TaxID=190721 RepID=A0A848NV47_9RALS|nr:YdaS family helix-turn-helix protein [Ralstonia insidiosa]NMV37219.1 helix-turn-helix domain-containing protein [Ralstonia insidiosa]
MNHTNPSRPALEKAIHLAGSQAELARRIGKKQPHIFKWLNSPNGVPEKYCYRIERAVGGLVTRRHLRPDDWQDTWPELAEGHEVRSQA